MVNGFRSLICLESFTIPLLLYALIKLILPVPKKNSLLAKKILIFTLRTMLTTFALVPLLVFLILCAIYFEIIKVLAKLNYGLDYHGEFIGADAVWSNDSPECKSIIHVLYLLEDKPETPTLMKDLFTDSDIQDTILRNHPRLSCLRKYLLGYNYFIKIKVDYTQVVTYLDDYDTLDEFKEVINKKTSAQLPYNDELLWEVNIGRKLVELEKGKLQYPVLTRFHHSVGDGVALSIFMMTCYGKNGMARMKSECDRYARCFKKTEKNNSNEPVGFLKLFKQCKSLLSQDVYLHYNMLKHKEKPNVLHQKLSGDKVVCFSLENEENNDTLLEKVKKIKNKLNVAFADVILAAISASFTNYFVKHQKSPPKNIMSSNPYFLKAEEIDNIFSLNDKNEPVTNLGNKFTLGFFELPVDGEMLKSPISFIRKLHKTTKAVKGSMDFTLVYWLFNIIGTIVPRPVTTPIACLFDATTCITNVPGVLKLRYRNDCKVENVFFWINHWRKIGSSISLFTYNDRLRVTLHLDKSMAQDCNEIQKLCDNIIKYINIMYEETFKT